MNNTQQAGEAARQDKFLNCLLENYDTVKRAINEPEVAFPGMSKMEAVVETYDDMIALYKSSITAPAPAPEGVEAKAVLIEGATEWLSKNSMTLDSWGDNAACVIDYLDSVNALAGHADGAKGRCAVWIPSSNPPPKNVAVIGVIWKR